MRSDPQAVTMLTRVFPDVFPWVRFLPGEAVREFLLEFMETARAASELGTVAPLSPVIAAWKAPAEIHADPALRERLSRPPEGDLGLAQRPVVDAD